MGESTGAIILSPRLLAVGDPAGKALENIGTAVLGDGALCFVQTGAGKGEWQLDKASSAVADGVTVVAPIAGPGRWLKFSTSGTGLPIATIQTIAAAGPTDITDTLNTHARVLTTTIGGASAAVLPAGAVGKQITVKDGEGSASTNPITVTPQAGGSIDGAGSDIIQTNWGSATYRCVSTGPDVWETI